MKQKGVMNEAPVRFDDHQIPHAHHLIFHSVGEVEEVRAPGFEFDDVEGPGRGDGVEGDAFA